MNKTNMAHDVRTLPIDDLMVTVGRQLRARIRQQGTMAEFARRAGVAPRTLSRLVAGDDVGVENLYRVLRALERWDVLEALVREPEPTPLELLDSTGPRPRKVRPRKVSAMPPYRAHLARPRRRDD